MRRAAIEACSISAALARCAPRPVQCHCRMERPLELAQFVISVFQLTNSRGRAAPNVNIEYQETDSDVQWRITCGGSRAYAVRVGEDLDQDIGDQAADSHFMIRRVTSALLIAGFGLYRYSAVGRLFLSGVYGDVTWRSQLDADGVVTSYEESEVARFYDWFEAISKNVVLMRAADDARAALADPHEALVFVYRGLEWIKDGLKLSWDQLAEDIEVVPSELRDLKKSANVDTGVRHASRSGKKMRADANNYMTWVAGLFDAINAGRSRLEPGFEQMSPDEVVHAVMHAAPLDPYP